MLGDASRQDPRIAAGARHTLSVDETAAIFSEAGVPKSSRTVQRYCRSGILDCIRTDADLGDKYLIERASIDRRIDELKRFAEMMASTEVPTRPDMSRHDPSRHDTARNDATRRDDPDLDEDGRLKKLEAEVFNLKIDNRAKEIVITQLIEERRGFFSQITDQATRIGELSIKLRQLFAPNSSSNFDNEPEGALTHATTISPARPGDNSGTTNEVRAVDL